MPSRTDARAFEARRLERRAERVLPGHHWSMDTLGNGEITLQRLFTLLLHGMRKQY